MDSNPAPTRAPEEEASPAARKRLIVYLTPADYDQLAWLARAKRQRVWIIAEEIISQAMDASRQRTPAPPKK